LKFPWHCVELPNGPWAALNSKSIEPVVGQICRADHIGFFHRSRADQFSVIAPFVAEGLAANQRCLYVAQDNSVPMVLQRLNEAGVPATEAVRSGSLKLLTSRETFLRHGIFQMDRMVEYLREEVEAALHDGFAGLRASGEMTWALDTPAALEQRAEYECKLHAQFPQNGLCQYDECRFAPSTLSDMLHLHPWVLTRGQLVKNHEMASELVDLRSRQLLCVDDFVRHSH
jgi:hypothetical protein